MKKPSDIDLRAEQIRAALAAIAAANNDVLNPAHVVDAARDPLSVLHDEFVWDDEDAADAYRLAQAGALIRRVKFTLIRQSSQTKEIEVRTTRAYQSRPSQRSAEGGYEPVDQILADPGKRGELLDQVLRELAAYRKRYADLIALSEVWAAIDSAIDDLTAPGQGKAAQAGDSAAAG